MIVGPDAKGQTMIRRRTPVRRGVAAVEFAFVTMLFVVPLVIGVWEVGRLIQVQQIVSNAAREGARIGAQAVTLQNGVRTQIKTSASTPSVKSAVYQSLYAAGLTGLRESDVAVTFAFTSGRTTDYVPAPSDPPGTNFPAGSMPPDPCYGDKGQSFTVSVSIPWDKVRWVNIGLLRPAAVSYTVTWQMLIDERFTLTDTLPSW
jgi:Flp pilus assembly protein TadG